MVGSRISEMRVTLAELSKYGEHGKGRKHIYHSINGKSSSDSNHSID
jgi:hypothetical protein